MVGRFGSPTKVDRKKLGTLTSNLSDLEGLDQLGASNRIPPGERARFLGWRRAGLRRDGVPWEVSSLGKPYSVLRWHPLLLFLQLFFGGGPH